MYIFIFCLLFKIDFTKVLFKNKFFKVSIEHLNSETNSRHFCQEKSEVKSDSW